MGGVILVCVSSLQTTGYRLATPEVAGLPSAANANGMCACVCQSTHTHSRVLRKVCDCPLSRLRVNTPFRPGRGVYVRVSTHTLTHALLPL